VTMFSVSQDQFRESLVSVLARLDVIERVLIAEGRVTREELERRYHEATARIDQFAAGLRQDAAKGGSR
jgi:uroporphyrinogen-III synthase